MHCHWLRQPIKGSSVLQPTDEICDNLPQPWVWWATIQGNWQRQQRRSLSHSRIYIDFSPREGNDITPTTLEIETSAQEEQPINPIAIKPTDLLNNSQPHRETPEQVPAPEVRRSTKQRHAPQRLIKLINISKVIEPSTYNESTELPAMASSHAVMIWFYYQNKTWDLIDLPPRRKLITANMGFWRWRKDTKGPPIYKERLVDRGFEEQEGIDYEVPFVLVIKWNTLHLMVSKAASKEWKTLQLDVKSAFLYSLLKEIVLME